MSIYGMNPYSASPVYGGAQSQATASPLPAAGATNNLPAGVGNYPLTTPATAAVDNATLGAYAQPKPTTADQQAPGAASTLMNGYLSGNQPQLNSGMYPMASPLATVMPALYGMMGYPATGQAQGNNPFSLYNMNMAALMPNYGQLMNILKPQAAAGNHQAAKGAKAHHGKGRGRGGKGNNNANAKGAAPAAPLYKAGGLAAALAPNVAMPYGLMNAAADPMAAYGGAYGLSGVMGNMLMGMMGGMNNLLGGGVYSALY